MRREVSQRERLKRQRAEKIRHAQEVWKDQEYGISVSETRRGGRLTWDIDREQFVALMGLHQLRGHVLAGMEHDLVIGLRAAAIPWDEIGWALGISRDAVRKRHPDADRDVRAMTAGGEVRG
jgi:hypothetical protein